MKPVWIEVKGYSFLETFTTNEGIFYGEKLPDLAFVQLAIRDVPVLRFCSEPNAIRMGLDVAFGVFLSGQMASCCASTISHQSSSRPRHSCGTVPSAACIRFHVRGHMDFRSTQFSTVEQAVLRFFDATTRQCWGCCDAAFEGQGVTCALPGHLLHWAATVALADGTLNVDGVP